MTLAIAPVVSTAPALFRSAAAPAERTLLDVLAATAALYPHHPAIDDGEAAADLPRARARRSTSSRSGSPRPASAWATGSACGSPRAPRTCTSRSWRCWPPARPTCRWTPRTRTSAPTWCSARPRSARCSAPTARSITRTAPIGLPGAPGARRRRVDHLHVRLHRQAQGRRGHPPRRGGLRGRRGRGCSWSTSRSARATGCWPGCRWRSTPPARRCGWPGATAPAWCRHRARWCAPASTWARGWRAQRITVVSTVPTLAALWPADALDDVRLLIFGGEACPPELAERVAVEGREVWNTYGPTEATVVACAAQLDRRGPGPHRAAAGRLGAGRRGRATATPVAMGETGELVIGGVGLARYLDAAKDAEKYAPLPSLGWDRAYRSGDLVRAEPDGPAVPRPGRRAGQAGRPADRAGRGRRGPAGAARRRAALRPRCAARGRQPGARRLPRRRAAEFDTDAAVAAAARALPAALVPLLAVVDDLPTRTSGKVDRDALPWPLPTAGDPADGGQLDRAPRRGWQQGWPRSSASPVATRRRLLRQRRRQPGRGPAGGADPGPVPEGSVSDIYQYPTLGELAAALDESRRGAADAHRDVAPTPRAHRVRQVLLMLPAPGGGRPALD